MESQKEKKNIWKQKVFKEIMSENSLNWAKEINLQDQEAEQNPNRINPRKSMPRHIVITPLKARQKKQWERDNTLPVEEEWFEWQWMSHIKSWSPEGSAQHFQVLKEKNSQLWILYLVKIFFRHEEKIKIFSAEGKQREFVNARPTLK